MLDARTGSVGVIQAPSSAARARGRPRTSQARPALTTAIPTIATVSSTPTGRITDRYADSGKRSATAINEMANRIRLTSNVTTDASCSGRSISPRTGPTSTPTSSASSGSLTGARRMALPQKASSTPRTPTRA